MNLDDRAKSANLALSVRSTEIPPHRGGLNRRRWVAPVGVVGTALVVLLVAIWIGQFASGSSGQIETVAVPDETTVLTVDGVRGPILAGYISVSGEISVLVGDASSARLVQLDASAGAPVLGVDTIPEPRWRYDDRVVEYVADFDGELSVVRVDVRTGRSTTEPYWVVLFGGGISKSLEDEGPITGSIVLMAGAGGPRVGSVQDDAGARWELRTFTDDRSVTLDLESTRFLAPAMDGLIVVADGVLGTMAGDGVLTELGIDGVTAETISAVAPGPGSEMAFGLKNGSVLVTAPETTESLSFDLGADVVTGLSWSPSGEVFIATAAEQDETSIHLCAVATTSCDRIALAGAAGGRLIRGTPTPPDTFFGVWPENTQEAADTATAAENAPAWRFDPDLLVREFAEVILGWTDPIVTTADGSSLFPHWSSFEVRPSPDEALVTINAAQLARDNGWVITGVRAPILSLRTSFSSGGPVTIGFDRKGAETVEVIIRLGDEEYSQRTDDLDVLEFDIDRPFDAVASYLILFRDDDDRVFSAILRFLGDPGLPIAIG
ncbi:MAG: hypothetical protein GXP35_16100 [Actinobacteria bacterium]|nr:hypothetical protein [Actinomycetota bacterium]